MKILKIELFGLAALNECEMKETSGGGRMARAILLAGAFLVSPALGLFHMGVGAGYREEASK